MVTLMIEVPSWMLSVHDATSCTLQLTAFLIYFNTECSSKSYFGGLESQAANQPRSRNDDGDQMNAKYGIDRVNGELSMVVQVAEIKAEERCYIDQSEC